MGEQFLGIDFSGGAAPWRQRCAKPSVWIATVEDDALVDLAPVQALGGEGAPFDRLVALLKEGDFRAAGIDAPCSLPTRHMPTGGHRALLKTVRKMPPAPDRPFPRGADLLRLAEAVAPLEMAKPVREAEAVWRRKGVNVRSTLWNGARGGAPFTAACLTLLARAERRVWPWSDGEGIIVEAFPAGQLNAWSLPHAKYAGTGDGAVREVIVAALRRRLSIKAAFRKLMTDCPDALDAVLASFGARAAAMGRLAEPLPDRWRAEGAIAVHD
jgi:Protein of unknown function (DUF429)